MRQISIISPSNCPNLSYVDMEERGLGGTETSILMISKSLYDLGIDVRLYGFFPDSHFGGLKLRNINQALDDSHDLVIYARNLWAADEIKIRYKQAAVWVHDAGFNIVDDWKLRRIHRVLVGTQWHKDRVLEEYPYLNPGGILLTPNGIRSSTFHKESKKIPGKFIYSAAPNRGLENIIDIWPEIKNRIPEATLHIFHGFDLWETSNLRNPQMYEHIQNLKRKVKDYETLGVIYRGKVGQNTLADEMLSSTLWLYPTNYCESFCISAVEAQCAGCRVVGSSIAALREVVKYGSLIIGDANSHEYKRRFLEAVVYEHNHYQYSFIQEQRTVMTKLYDWSTTAKMWEKEYLSEPSLPGTHILK